MSTYKQHGFGVIELLIALAFAAVISLVTWRVYKANYQPSNQGLKQNGNEQTNGYKRTSTMPGNWKTHTEEKYGLSLGYPPNWKINTTLISKKPGEATQNVFSLNANEIFVVCYSPIDQQQSCASQINIQDQSLEDTVSQARKYFMTAGLLGEKKLTIDGHQSVEFKSKQGDGPTERHYFVFANGRTFALPVVYEDKSGVNLENVLTPQDSLLLFESIKIAN